MPPVKLDLIWTIFWVFCGYSVYTSFVSFMWEAKGKRVFRNLTIPLVVFVYFLVPCIALYLLNTAFSDVNQFAWKFVIPFSFILSLSFVVMLYILTVPDWPVGKFLQIGKVPVSAIRFLVSVNFSGSLLIAIVCGIIVVQAPRNIQQQGQGMVVQELEARGRQLDEEKSRSNETISEIHAVAIRSVIDDIVTTAQGVITLGVSLVGLFVSIRALGGKKNSEEKQGESKP